MHRRSADGIVTTSSRGLLLQCAVILRDEDTSPCIRDSCLCSEKRTKKNKFKSTRELAVKISCPPSPTGTPLGEESVLGKGGSGAGGCSPLVLLMRLRSVVCLSLC